MEKEVWIMKKLRSLFKQLNNESTPTYSAIKSVI